MRSESSLSPSDRRGLLRDAFARCRLGTLALFDDVDETGFRRQLHPEFSPVGWHLGHIAYVEALWLIGHGAGRPLPRPELEETFSVTARPKHERGNLPPVEAVFDYGATVRAEAMRCLDAADLSTQERLWYFVLQHEAQHGETVAFLRRFSEGGAAATPTVEPADSAAMIAVPAGAVTIGGDGPEALDNECGRHPVFVPAFRIGRYPVTQGRFARFMADGGYRQRRWWSAEGWAWLQAAGVTRPLYWREGCDGHPVAGVSAYEADAFCRHAGLRLPTEFEWEKAARWGGAADELSAAAAPPYPWGTGAPGAAFCNNDRRRGGTSPVDAHPAGRTSAGGYDFLGNVWEWTTSPFAAYPGYESYPYDGYSAAYFDGRHRVLRGGSWATRPWALRISVRNWYTPNMRQILAGFRCAQDA